MFKNHPTLGAGVADAAASEGAVGSSLPDIGTTSHLSEASSHVAVISKPPSRPVTPTSAVVDVSSDNDGADGGEELEPRTKK